jgi:hypothetical protein
MPAMGLGDLLPVSGRHVWSLHWISLTVHGAFIVRSWFVEV